MAFQYDARDLDSLENYEQALAYWKAIVPWRGRSDDDPKPIESRSKKHATIRKQRDGSIACQLHSTDVVLYNPDGSIDLQPYPSVSTDAFANAILPHGVRTSFNAGHIFVLYEGRSRHYQTGYSSTHVLRLRRVDGGWDVQNAKPWKVPVIDQKAARGYLKQTRYHEFKQWWEMRDVMEHTSTSPDNWRYADRRHMTAAELMAGGPELWATTPRSKTSVAYHWEGLRADLLKSAGLLAYEEKPFLDGYGEVEAFKRKARLWGES